MNRITKRTDSSDPDFVQLVQALDAELAIFNGDHNSFYASFNQIPALQHVILIYIDHSPVACGAFKPFDERSVEIKRMYVRPDFRRQGLAEQLLMELETWAREEKYECTVLETGRFLPGTIALYSKAGYHEIPNYGPYKGLEASICFRKAV
jgi:GNAT superfamily N-acetyltransferase